MSVKRKTQRKRTNVVNRKVTSVTIADAAKTFGVQVNAVKENTMLIRDQSGMVDLDASYRQFKSMEEARHFREEIDSNIRLVRYAKLRGEVISAELVARTWAEEWTRTRDAFLALADRIAGELAAITDPKMVRSKLLQAYNETMLLLRDTWVPPEPTIRKEQSDEPYALGTKTPSMTVREPAL